VVLLDFSERNVLLNVNEENNYNSWVLFRPYGSTAYIDAAYCYRMSSVVCRSVTLVSPAKTAAPIKMPFGLVLDGDPAVLRDVAIATNFGTQFAITGFWAITLDV